MNVEDLVLGKFRAGRRFFVFETTDMYRINQIYAIATRISTEFFSVSESASIFPVTVSVFVPEKLDKNGIYVVRGIMVEKDVDVLVDLIRQLRNFSVFSGVVLAVVPRLSYIPDALLDMVDVIQFGAPDDEERRSVIKSTLNSMGVLQEVTEGFVKYSRGLSLEDINLAVADSVMRYGEVKEEIFREYKVHILEKHGLEYIEPKITFEHVGGNDYLKNYVKEHVLVYFRNPEAVRKFGLKVPRGMLMAGVGGTGKSWFATALAGEMSVPVVKMDMADVMAGGMGETQLRKILRIIDTLSPVVVFMDEIDQIAMKREQVKSEERRGMVNVLMEWLGDSSKEAFVVGATNLIHQIDENFLRSGRFDAIIYVPPPDRKGREEILKIHATKLRKLEGVEFNPEILSAVAEKTELWVGSDLEALVQKAFEYAMIDYLKGGEARITEEHFERAMKDVEPNMELRKNMLKVTLEGMKMLPQGAVAKEPIEETELMINIGKRRKAERKEKEAQGGVVVGLGGRRNL